MDFAHHKLVLCLSRCLCKKNECYGKHRREQEIEAADKKRRQQGSGEQRQLANLI